MSLIVIRQPLEGTGREDCCICGQPTPFWYEANDVAVCRPCAEITPPHKVPSKRQWLEAQGMVLPPGWVPYVETTEGLMNQPRTKRGPYKPRASA